MAVYHLLAHLLAAIGVPVVLVLAAFSEKYRFGLGQRFGRLPLVPAPRGGARRVWLHCASVGEVQTAAALIEGFLADPGVDLVLSTMTPTGQALARTKYAGRCPVIFWPVELAFAVRRTMDAVRPDLLAILETELWPAVLAAARARGVPVAVLSARVSDRAFARYRRIAFFLVPLLRGIALVTAQSDEAAARLRALGVPADRVGVTGNLKFDLGLDREAVLAAPSVVDRWAAPGPIFVAASTHEGEDDPVIAAYRSARERVPDLRMVLAPRHLERADAVARLLAARDVPFARRTEVDRDASFAAPVLLLDTIGELVPAMARADVCFVGGSLVPVGGHNILEPAALGVPVLFGPRMENFRDARDAVLAAEGGCEVAGADDLCRRVVDLLRDPDRRRRMGEAGRHVVSANAGAAKANLDRVARLLAR